MAIRKIVTEEDPVIRKKSRLVDDVFNERVQTLIEDMKDTLYNTSNGIGLAAVQVGVLKRIFIIDLGDDNGLSVFINPEVLESSGTQSSTEGCLSVPGWWGEVERPAYMKIRAMNQDGEWFEMEGEGLLATCMSHESDHLNATLFKDKVKGELTQE